MADQRSSNANYAWASERPGDFAGMTSRPTKSYDQRNDSADALRNPYVQRQTRVDGDESDSFYEPRTRRGRAVRHADDVTFEDLLWGE